MSIPYELTGRTNQKARTRAAMLAATHDLLAEGVSPTVEQAAERASVSRTTAYRYFPNQRSLLVACYPELELSSLIGPDAPEEPEARLEMVLDHVARQLLAHEAVHRSMLRLALEDRGSEGLPLRQGRVIGWLEDALAPAADRLSGEERRGLALAIRAAFGIEPFVWLVDVAGLSREEAVELMRATARTLLRAALA